jgi:uncharacterized membrane protein
MGKKLNFILILGLLLRLVSLNQSLWLDEAIGALYARDLSFTELITKFIAYDNHTPGYYLLLKFWGSVFGYSEIGIRSLSVLFGVLSIYLVIEIAKLVSSKKSTPLLAALLIATSQIHIYYSQEARMYMMASFFAALAVLYFLKAVKEKTNINWLIFSASLVLLLATDYMPIFLLPIFPVYLLVKNRKLFKKFALSLVPLLLAAILWLPTLSTQLVNYSDIPDKFLFGGATFKQAALVWMKFVFGRLSFDPKWLYYSFVALSSIPIFIALKKSLLGQKRLLIILWAAVPLILGFTISFIIPAFSYFRFMYVFPAFVILIVLGIEKVQSNKLSTLLIASIVSLNIFSSAIYYIDIRQQREQWREAVEYVEENPDDLAIALFSFPEPFAPYQWYSKGVVDAAGGTNSISAGKKTTEKTLKLIENKQRIFYFEYLREVSDSEGLVRKAISESGFIETEKTSEFIGIGAITIYEK